MRLQVDLREWTILRFASVGFVNTIVGYSVIVASLGAGLGDFVANALGYGVGLAVGFSLNRHWAFRAHATSWRLQAPVFGAAFLVSYGANLAVLGAGRQIGLVEHPLLHLAAMATYSALFYLLSRTIVFGSRTERIATRLPGDAAPPLVIVTLCALLWIALQDIPLTHDVIWQLWIARQMNHGVELFSEIVELNPPLWFWMAQPLVWLSQISGLTPSSSLVLVVLAYVAGANLLLAHLNRDLPLANRIFLIAASVLLMTVTPLYDFGQREQLALIGAVPYAALIAARVTGSNPSAGLALAIGALAAPAFALKHYFLAVPLLLELWAFYRLRGMWRPLRPETTVLALSGLFYAIAVLCFAPDFLRSIVPMVQTSYFGYEVPLEKMYDEPVQILWILMAAAILLRVLDSRSLPAPAVAYLLAGLGFLVAYVVQHKGWQYHAIPVTGCLALVLCSILVTGNLTKAALRWPLTPFVLALTLALGLLNGPYGNWNSWRTDQALGRTKPGERILVLTADPMYSWPLVEERELAWTSRYFAFWMLPAVALNRHAGEQNRKLVDLGHEVQRLTVEDMRCNPPHYILNVQDPRHKLTEINFNMLHFLLEDASFRALFANYRPSGSVEFVQAYRLKHDVVSSRRRDCRRLH